MSKFQPPSMSAQEEFPSFVELCDTGAAKTGHSPVTVAQVMEAAGVAELLQQNHDLRAECAGRRRFTSRLSRLQAETASIRDHTQNRLEETQVALEKAWRKIGVLEEQLLRAGVVTE